MTPDQAANICASTRNLLKQASENMILVRRSAPLESLARKYAKESEQTLYQAGRDLWYLNLMLEQHGWAEPPKELEGL